MRAWFIGILSNYVSYLIKFIPLKILFLNWRCWNENKFSMLTMTTTIKFTLDIIIVLFQIFPFIPAVWFHQNLSLSPVRWEKYLFTQKCSSFFSLSFGFSSSTFCWRGRTALLYLHLKYPTHKFLVFFPIREFSDVYCFCPVSKENFSTSMTKFQRFIATKSWHKHQKNLTRW